MIDSFRLVHQNVEVKSIFVLQRETHCKKDNLTQYKCGVCNAEFASLFRRDRHLSTHSSISTTRDVVVCKLCGKNCVRQSYLTTHLQSHQLIYFCCVCSAFFPSSLRLVNHLNIHQSLTASRPPLSSTDLFWQSIAVSVLLLKSNSSTVSWLTGITDTMCDEQMNNSLDGALLDVAVFPHPTTEILTSIANSALQCDQEAVELREQTHAENTGVDAQTSSLDITCIDRNVCLKLGYKPMTQDVFSCLRQTFGCIECESCGQLFFVQSDLETHMNVHTGECLLFYFIISHIFSLTIVIVWLFQLGMS